jgi:cobalt-zinc-cadmium resistance protein CzcA
MIQQIIRFSVRNQFLILLGVLGLIAWGLYALRRLPLDAIPDVTNNQVVVATLAPNLSAVEMEQFVTYPIEIAMRNVPGMTGVRSVSQFGLSIVTLVFKDDVNLYFARSQVNERLQAVREEIPAGYGAPVMNPVTTGLGEVYQYVIRPTNPNDTTWSPRALRTLQDWVVKKQLLGVEGVAEISSFGGYLKQWHVRVQPERLRATGVTLAEVYEAVSAGNENTGAAYIEKDARNYFIRGIGIAREKSDLEQIMVRPNHGVPVLVRDVAEVVEGNAIRYGALTQNNREAVGGIVLMLKGSNSREVVLSVKERLKQVEKSLPTGLKVEAFLDRELLIDRTVHTVSKNLLEGGLIVIFVLVLLLGHLRAGLIVASVIPLSMLFAIGCMVLFGVSGNLMSLGAIDFGLIVDGAVIIVENIIRLLHERVGDNREDLVEEGAIGMAQSSFFGQLIILIVYLPLLTLSGIEGKMFQPMALTVIFALAGAVILSMTYVPAMSAWLLKKDHSHSETFSDRLTRILLRIYGPVINGALAYKKTVLGVSLVFLLIAFFVFRNLGGEFIPQLDEGDFVVEIRMAPGTSLTQMVKSAKIAGTKIQQQFPNEVKLCTGKIGTSEVPMDPMSIEEMDMVVSMHDQGQWKRCRDRKDFEVQLKALLDQIPGIYTSIQQPISMRFNELMTGAKTDVIVKIYGNDLNRLASLANSIVRRIDHIPGVVDASVAKAEGLPQIFVNWHRDALARYGISMRDANNTLRMAMAGMKAGIFFEENRRYDIVVNLKTPSGQSLETLNALLVSGPGGVQIPVRELASVEITEGPMAVLREDGERCLNVNLNVRGRDIQSVVDDVRQAVSGDVILPPGYHITYGGQFENLQHASARLKLVVPAALLMILLLLFLSFRTIRESLLIFSAIPLAAVGGVLALWIRGMPFSISAGVGFIALFGVAVLNGMVLIGFFKQLEEERPDLSVRDRVLQGVFVRFRPVIMTALVASLGFLPMAVSSGAGAEVQKPLATVVIGGLISATLLTLVVLPVLYEWAVSGKKKRPLPLLAAVLIVLAGCAFPVSGYSQKKISESEAVQRALKVHPALLQSSLNEQRAKVLLPAVSALPPLQAHVWGPFNPEIGVTQDFEPASLRRAGRAVQNRKIAVANAETDLIRRDIRREVRQAFEKTVYWQEKLRLYATQDSLLAAYAKTAVIERQAGSISDVIRLQAEARARDARLQMVQALESSRMAMDELRLLTGMADSAMVIGEPLRRRPLPDTLTGFPPAIAQYWDASDRLAIDEITWQQKKSLPGFALGTVVNTDPWNRFLPNLYVGINVPIARHAIRAREEAVVLDRQIMSARMALQRQEFLKRRRQVMAGLRSAAASLELLETFGASQENALLEAANLSRQVGETTAYEYLQTITTVFDLRARRLEALHGWNEATIELEQ